MIVSERKRDEAEVTPKAFISGRTYTLHVLIECQLPSKVQYMMSGDRALDFHFDDAEVTLNVCLGVDFEGTSEVHCVVLRWRCFAVFLCCASS